MRQFIRVFSLIFVGAAVSLSSAQDRKINDDTGDAVQDWPAIAMHPYGPAAIVWQDERNGDADIYLQFFSRRAAAIGGNVRVNDDTGSQPHDSPDVAMDIWGGYTVVWSDYRNTRPSIYAQHFAANGRRLGGNAVISDDGNSSTQRNPAVAVDYYGNRIVAWTDARIPYHLDVFAQRLDRAGNKIGANFRVNANDSLLCDQVAVAVAGDGPFLICWEARMPGTTITRVQARVFAADGTPIGDEFLVSDHPESDERAFAPSVASGAGGIFVVIWLSGYQTNDFLIYGSTYDREGNRLLGPELLVDPASFRFYRSPSICAHPNFLYYPFVWLGMPDSQWELAWDRYAPGFGVFLNPAPVHDAAAKPMAVDIAAARLRNTVFVWADERNGDKDIYGNWQGENMPMRTSAGSGFDGRVPISWEPSYGLDRPSRFIIYRQDPGTTTPQHIATVDPAARPYPALMLDYIDRTVENGQKYLYAVMQELGGEEFLLEFVEATPTAGGHRLRSHWLRVYPSIDGHIDPQEWADAAELEIANPHAPEPVTLLLKNDGIHLYVAVRDANDDFVDPGNLLGLLFDEDNDGAWEPSFVIGEGAIALTQAAQIFTPYIGAYPEGLRLQPPRQAEGVEFAIAANDGQVHYEARISLIDSPLFAYAGNTVGFAVWIDDPGRFYGRGNGNAGEWPPDALWDAAETLGDLILATPEDTVRYVDWPMINGNRERNNWARDEDELAPPFSWQTTLTDRHANIAGVSGSFLVFAGSGDPSTITVFDLANDQEVWSQELPGSVGSVGCSPAVGDGRVFAGAQGAQGLYAFDLHSGEIEWFKPLGSLFGRHPVVDGNMVFICKDSLSCFYTADGTLLWSFGDAHFDQPITPVVDRSSIYLHTTRELVCLNKINGSVRWRTPCGHQINPLTVDEHHLYAFDQENLVAFDKTDGTRIWSRAVEGHYDIERYSNPFAVTDAHLFLSIIGRPENTSRLIAFDKFTGTEMWRRTFALVGVDPPTVANSVVYIRDWVAGIWGFDCATGDSLFFHPDEFFTGQAVIGNHSLLIPSQRGIKLLSNVEPPTRVASDAAVDDYRLQAAYPNPFNARTTIVFHLPHPEQVTLEIFDVRGRRIAALLQNESMPAGTHRVNFDAAGLSSGVYFYRLQRGGLYGVNKMVLLK